MKEIKNQVFNRVLQIGKQKVSFYKIWLER